MRVHTVDDLDTALNMLQIQYVLCVENERNADMERILFTQAQFFARKGDFQAALETQQRRADVCREYRDPYHLLGALANQAYLIEALIAAAPSHEEAIAINQRFQANYQKADQEARKLSSAIKPSPRLNLELSTMRDLYSPVLRVDKLATRIEGLLEAKEAQQALSLLSEQETLIHRLSVKDDIRWRMEIAREKNLRQQVTALEQLEQTEEAAKKREQADSLNKEVEIPRALQQIDQCRLHHHGWVYTKDYAKAMALLSEAEDLCRAVNHIDLLRTVLTEHKAVAQTAGDTDALAKIDRAMGQLVLQKTASPMEVFEMTNLIEIGMQLANQGQWQPALEKLEGARQIARRTGDPTHLMLNAQFQSQVLMRLGKMPQAIECLVEAETNCQYANLRFNQVQLMQLRGVMVRNAGDKAEACKILLEALKTSKEEESVARSTDKLSYVASVLQQQVRIAWEVPPDEASKYGHAHIPVYLNTLDEWIKVARQADDPHQLADALITKFTAPAVGLSKAERGRLLGEAQKLITDHNLTDLQQKLSGLVRLWQDSGLI